MVGVSRKRHGSKRNIVVLSRYPHTYIKIQEITSNIHDLNHQFASRHLKLFRYKRR